ncbi:MAG: hypothetical protein JXB49_26920 [Bacteroidales bacterium]|nr:hypothetical protein [Bacteroidales bacterium]
MVEYIRHNDIDKQRWDECIESASNRLLYAYSWYLDIVCPKWDALVEGDYEVVMPLTWNKKYGLEYLYQPFFTQQLGVFGKEGNIRNIDDYVDILIRNFKFIEYCFNSKNDCKLKDFIKRTDQILSLEHSYSAIYEKFSTRIKRSLRTSETFSLKYDKNLVEEGFLLFMKQHPQSYLSSKAGKILMKLIERAPQFRKMYRGVRNANGNLIAAIFILDGEDRLIPPYSINTEEGKASKAFFFLINSIIEEFSNSPRLFDFAGSNLPGVKLFNAGFGAFEEHYFLLKINRLPFYLKWMK